LEVDDPKRFLKKHIIMGEKSDEIPAIKERVGEKTAIKMLPSIDMLLETDKNMEYRYRINECLIDLRLVPESIQGDIGHNWQQSVDNFNFDANGMLEFLSKYKCRELTKKINTFKLPIGNGNYNTPIHNSDYNKNVVESFLDEL